MSYTNTGTSTELNSNSNSNSNLNQYNLPNVYVVNLKYLIGWKSIKVDELEETNESNVLGIYIDKENAYKKAIEHNKKLLNNIMIYSGDYYNHNEDNYQLESETNLFDKYNDLLLMIESKRLVNKYMEQYAVVSEFEVK